MGEGGGGGGGGGGKIIWSGNNPEDVLLYKVEADVNLPSPKSVLRDYLRQKMFYEIHLVTYKYLFFLVWICLLIFVRDCRYIFIKKGRGKGVL